MKEIIDFLGRLSANNERAWFDAHRAEWTHVRGRVTNLAAQLIDGIGSFDPAVRGLQPRDCTYRIARDTRFSNDKTPYKNWIGIFVAPHGKKSGYAGYYLHISPVEDALLGGRHMLISGLYCPEGAVLRSVRDEIFDNGAEFRKNVAAASGFGLDTRNALKRTPQGFPSGSEFDDLLRLREFCLAKPVDDAFLSAPDAVERIVGEFRRTHPFVEQLNRAVQYAYEEMM